MQGFNAALTPDAMPPESRETMNASIIIADLGMFIFDLPSGADCLKFSMYQGLSDTCVIWQSAGCPPCHISLLQAVLQ